MTIYNTIIIDHAAPIITCMHVYGQNLFGSVIIETRVKLYTNGWPID